MRILLFGSDPGTTQGPPHPTYRRLKSYARRLEWLGILNYSTPNHKPIIDKDVPLYVFPTNSFSKVTYLLDAVIMGSRIIRRFKVQALAPQDPFIFGLAAYLLSLMHKIPFVIHVHADMLGNEYWLREKWSHRLLNCLGRFIAGKAHRIRTVSSKIREDLIRMGYPASKIYYVSPPVNPEYAGGVDPSEVEALAGGYGPEKGQMFLSIGRLSYQKNLDLLLKATAILKKTYPEIRVLVLGEGPERHRLLALRDKLGISRNVEFPGAVPNRHLILYFRVSLALVLTSQYEGTAKVIKEAAFAGKPTISTGTSGVSDAIRDGETGLVIPVEDVDALAGAMAYFLKNPAQSSIMGLKARDFVTRKFDYQRDVDALVAVWKGTALSGYL